MHSKLKPKKLWRNWGTGILFISWTKPGQRDTQVSPSLFFSLLDSCLSFHMAKFLWAHQHTFRKGILAYTPCLFSQRVLALMKFPGAICWAWLLGFSVNSAPFVGGSGESTAHTKHVGLIMLMLQDGKADRQWLFVRLTAGNEKARRPNVHGDRSTLMGKLNWIKLMRIRGDIIRLTVVLSIVLQNQIKPQRWLKR